MLSRIADGLSELDVQAALADVARAYDWSRPIVDTSAAFEIEAGRHPVVEAALLRTGDHFVANGCNLADQTKTGRVVLLTGPNMAGKSTYLRQNALIALLAQAGAYVPAARARIGVVDKIFSRVGASDDLARGRSTFMVEMVETAAILNQATDKSLVILDEIGRGTATYDGLSIAWATLEHLHDGNRCRAIFATHYHELTALSSKLGGLKNATIAVREWDGDVVFLHEVTDGAADRSYGVQVARLAGLPAPVIDRAKGILEMLEKDGFGKGSGDLLSDLPLFAQTAPPEPEKSPALEILEDVDADDLSPREALDLVYRLKAATRL